MKNLILLFLFIGIPILSQAQTKECCDPCPPECCITACDTDARANMQSTNSIETSKMSIQVLCASVPEASCSSTKVRAYTEANDNASSILEPLPQTMAMVEDLPVRSVSSQIPIHLYKGEL